MLHPFLLRVLDIRWQDFTTNAQPYRRLAPLSIALKKTLDDHSKRQSVRTGVMPSVRLDRDTEFNQLGHPGRWMQNGKRITLHTSFTRDVYDGCYMVINSHMITSNNYDINMGAAAMSRRHLVALSITTTANMMTPTSPHLQLTPVSAHVRRPGASV